MAVTTVTASLAGTIQQYGAISTNWVDDVRNSSGEGNSTVYINPPPGGFVNSPQTAFSVAFGPDEFGEGNEGTIRRTFLFFGELDSVIGGLIITAATLKISGSTQPSPSSTTQDSIIVGSSAYGGNGNSALNGNDYSLLSFSNPYSSTLTSWTNTDYNSYTLNASAISDMNNNGYLNCVIINENNDFQGVAPALGTATGSSAIVTSAIPVQLVLTYEYIATRNASVTQSVGGLGGNLFAGTPVTFSIDNPLPASSYFALETTRNADGFYDSNSPKNLQGTFTLGAGIIDVISDNYKAGVVVAPGGGNLVFTPTNNVTAATLLPKGTGWSGPVYPPPPKPVPLPIITCSPGNGIGLYFSLLGGFFTLAKLTYNGDDFQGLPTYTFPQVITAGSKIDYDLNYTSPQWGLSVTAPLSEIDAATSSDLVSSNWTSAGDDLVVSSTTCGYPNSPDFCVVMPGSSGNIQVNILPIWTSMDNINTDPIGYFAFFVDFSMIWLPTFGGPNGWQISVAGSYSTTISGGSVDAVPTGTFTLASQFDPSQTVSITISAGVCSI